MGLNEALLTQEGDGTSQLKTLTKALPINWHSWVGALIVAKCYVEEQMQQISNHL